MSEQTNDDGSVLVDEEECSSRIIASPLHEVSSHYLVTTPTAVREPLQQGSVTSSAPPPPPPSPSLSNNTTTTPSSQQQQPPSSMVESIETLSPTSSGLKSSTSDPKMAIPVERQDNLIQDIAAAIQDETASNGDNNIQQLAQFLNQIKANNYSPSGNDGTPRNDNDTSSSSLSSSSLASTSTASSSSPNPNCSPFKLLITERAPASTVTTATSPVTTNSGHLLHEEKDPIVVSGSPSSALTSNNHLIRSPTSTSQEFSMNLNFNLAVAAASKASAPLVVNATTSSINQQHQRFTSNASTSSIHNNLKMILEESCTKTLPSNSAHSSSSKQTTPNQQTTKLSNSYNKSPRQQQQHKFSKKSLSDEIAVESSSNSPFLKVPIEPDSADLMKIIMMMAQNPHQNFTLPPSDEASKHISSSLKDPSKPKQRYSKETLLQIRDQRKDMINQIYPELFQAYRYCMNGDFWDPEKYFDAIQSGNDSAPMFNNNTKHFNEGGFSKFNPSYLQHQNQQNQRGVQNHNFPKQQQQRPSTFNAFPSQVPPNPNSKPVGIKKKHPKYNYYKNNNRANSESSETTTNLNSSEANISTTTKVDANADQILMSLIKKSDSKQPTLAKLDIIGMVNKKLSSADSGNALSELLTAAKMTTPAVSNKADKILTVEELESSQFSNQQSKKAAHHIQSEFENAGNDAYKQLVKNLSNHPLNPSSQYQQQQQLSANENLLMQKLKRSQQQQFSQKSPDSIPPSSPSSTHSNILQQLFQLNEQNIQKNNTINNKMLKSSSTTFANKSSPSQFSLNTNDQPPLNSTFPKASPSFDNKLLLNSRIEQLHQQQQQQQQMQHHSSVDSSQILNIMQMLQQAQQAKLQQQKQQQSQLAQQKPINTLLRNMEQQRENEQLRSENVAFLNKLMSSTHTQSSTRSATLNTYPNSPTLEQRAAANNDFLKWLQRVELEKSAAVEAANKKEMEFMTSLKKLI